MNLIKTKDGKGIIDRFAKPGERSEKYIENALFLALGNQPFYCNHCGGELVDPNDYEFIEDIHICPKCKGCDGFGFTFWTPTKMNMSLDICINYEPKTISLIMVYIQRAAVKHGINIHFFLKEKDKYIPV